MGVANACFCIYDIFGVELFFYVVVVVVGDFYGVVFELGVDEF